MDSAADSPAAPPEPGRLRLRAGQDGPPPLALALDCPVGEIMAVVGPSGSGKTTLLRTLAGVFTPARGSIHFDGAVWLDRAAGINRRPRERSIGLVAQHYGLFPHLTARQNIMCALLDRAPGERGTRADALLERLHLDGLGPRRPWELSGGQQQRVALARALARDPRLLLLDEPFSAVDRRTRRQLYQAVVDLQAHSGTTVVLVTHDLREARLLAGRVAVVDGGSTLQQGPRTEVLNHPATLRVAEILDTPNLFAARFVGPHPDGIHALLDWEGERLLAPHPPWLTQPAEVGWFVAPSRVRLTRAPDTAPKRLRWRVEEVQVENDPVQVRLRHPGSGEWLRVDVRRDAGGGAGWTPGELVDLGIAPEAVRLVPGGNGSGDQV